MRSVIFLSSLLPLVIACDNPLNDACAASITASAAAASTFCATYTQSANTASTNLPDWASVGCANKYKKVSSACSCLNGGISTLATVTATKSSNFTLAYSTGTGVAIAKTTSAQTTLAIETSAAVSSSDIVAASSDIAASSEIASSTKAATKASTTAKAETTSAAVAATAAAGSACTVTDASGISSAVASCTNIVLSNIAMPSATTLDLTDLQDGTTVTFAGNTSFAYTEDSDFDPITIGGNNVIITGASGHVIDGNGPAYWDGEGSNGGTDKPDHFIVLDKMTSSTISNLNIKNWPVHCFDITGCTGLTITGLTLDNSEGDEPNSASGDDAAAHNSDGFDFSSTNDSILSNTIVKNQDDCVAITSGSNITVTGMTCSGGHGLSIGSVGGKSNNVVSDITFSDSTVTDSENGCRIKSNADTTGSITNIVYQNIAVSGITDYGIDVQQDYLNGGATGSPTNGVTIDGVTFTNVTGTATGTDYYILCGSDSCSNFTFTDVSITGGSDDSCNYPSTGCPS